MENMDSYGNYNEGLLNVSHEKLFFYVVIALLTFYDTSYCSTNDCAVWSTQ